MRLGKKKIATKMKIESRSKEETKTYQEWFNLVDSDGDGRISGNDTTKFFALSNLSRSQLKRLWALADVKRQGFLGFTEFVTAMQENIKPPVLEGLDALVASGPDQRSIPGNTIVVDAHMPFGGLATFGGSFLSKFQCSQMPHPSLDEVTFVDTPVISSYGTESSQASPIHTPYSE
ncbi:EH domain-containing protein 2 [Glycine max]|nr:EH domain-containing protein 2 [Glycine max]